MNASYASLSNSVRNLGAFEPHGDLEKVGGQSRGLDSELKANAIIRLNAARYDIRLS